VEDIITSLLKRDPYATLRTELVRRLSALKEDRIRKLLTFEMGDHKPFQFLIHLKSLAPVMPDDLLCSIWCSRLHSYIRAILAGQPKGNFVTAAHCADCIIEATPQVTLASVVPPPPPKNNDPRQYVEDL
jgi:hypothetical protein